MICPKCSTNHKYKYGMKCASCGYQFVVNPKTERELSDMKIKKFVEILSENNTKYFTQNQLLGMYARVVTKGSSAFFWILLTIIIGLLIITGYFQSEMAILVAVFGLIALLVAGAFAKFNTVPPSKNPFIYFFPKWQAQNKVPTYLTKPQLTKSAPASESDIYSYGAENLLIVDKNMYVDLLVKNGFHQQYKTIVISENMYPKHLANAVKKTLENNPEMPVYLLHDGDEKGEEMQNRLLKSTQINLKNHSITDLGLRQEHFKNAKFLRPYSKLVHAYFAPLDLLSYGQICHLFEFGTESGEAFPDDLVIADSTTGAIMDFG